MEQHDDANPYLLLQTLNDDVFRIILSYFTIHELCELHMTSKSFILANLSCEDCFWQHHYRTKLQKFKQWTAQSLFDPETNSKITTYPEYILKYDQKTSNFKYNLIEMNYELERATEEHVSQVFNELKTFKHLHSIPFYTKKELKETCSTISIAQYLKQVYGDLQFRVIVNGNPGVGKTCFLFAKSYNLRHSDMEYIPTVYENFIWQYTKGQDQIDLDLWDTAGQPDYDKLRVLCYPNASLFCLCFSVEDISSVRNLYHKWIPEIQTHCPNTPILLMGCKTDIRSNVEVCSRVRIKDLWRPLSFQDGEEIARALGCVTYVETSYVTMEGFDDITEIFVNVLYVHAKANVKKKKFGCKQQ
ncbi:hypothetical protein C9374_013032 [Naegleria lovaniensis]|uniref:Rho family small GTPase n=1 Tax=Naegleria lovaniensis TaxID=51637 RepID=A0AA88GCB7_NAELO|nr:uncharacterized protein C9374_013032 [Naegleria lovaniensis]KAG2372910.1 hypothetical protein C9374_013032 [Naegleria lovaniensis]